MGGGGKIKWLKRRIIGKQAIKLHDMDRKLDTTYLSLEKRNEILFSFYYTVNPINSGLRSSDNH
jgi:hypothetical protein